MLTTDGAGGTDLGGTAIEVDVLMPTGRFKTIILGTSLTGTDNGDDTITLEAPAAGGDPADDTLVWMPLADSDGIARPRTPTTP